MADDGKDHLYAQTMSAVITRIALYLTLGVLLDAFGWSPGSPQFWCMLALTIAADLLGRLDGRREGAMEGIAAFLKMNEQEQSDIRRLVRQWEQK